MRACKADTVDPDEDAADVDDLQFELVIANMTPTSADGDRLEVVVANEGRPQPGAIAPTYVRQLMRSPEIDTRKAASAKNRARASPSPILILRRRQIAHASDLFCRPGSQQIPATSIPLLSPA
jgi:hypothetical protein